VTDEGMAHVAQLPQLEAVSFPKVSDIPIGKKPAFYPE
jgi:hypothetical protein